MQIRLLALDLDGTLAWRGDEVLPATRAALHEAHACGIEVVIATGRRYRTTQRVVAALGLPVAAVCLGGALVKDAAGGTLHQAVFAPADFQAVAGIVRAHGEAPVAQRDAHGPDGGPDFLLDGAPAWNGATSRYMEHNQEWAEWRRDLAAEAREDVLVVGALGQREALEEAAEAIHQRFPGRFQSHVMPLPAERDNDGHYLEVAVGEVCKWTGLQHLAAHLGVPPEAICAVGDERNDLAMVESAALGVAMGNAHPELLEVADWVTGRHDEDGIVAVVERILTPAR